MDCKEWLELFKLSAKDNKVISVFAKNGIEDFSFTFRPTWTSGNVDFKEKGFSVGFISEFNYNGGNPNLPILSEIIMTISLGKKDKGWRIYEGQLPFGIDMKNSKEELFNMLGEPENFDDDFCSARWVINGLDLGIQFTEDWLKIKQIGLSIIEGY